jgi:predicted DNA-binding transcriptional regulator YafY
MDATLRAIQVSSRPEYEQNGDMADTASRVLELLSLLQTHRVWPGVLLAERLGITERTLRRDVDRLRELGYRIEAARGPGGGYRLEAGVHLPPLLLTEDEAVTVAVGLRSALAQGLVDGQHTTLSALAKFQQLLPSALQARTEALSHSLSTASPAGVPVAADLLGTLALSCRDHERLRFAYRAGDGVRSRRDVEPHALVSLDRRWFLLAWDRGRDDWRTFRIDRIAETTGTRVRFEPRAVPGGDAAAHVRAGIRAVRTPLRIEVVLHGAIESMRTRLGGWGGPLEPLDDDRCVWPIAGESVGHLASALAWVPPDVEFELRGEAGLLAAIAAAGTRIAAGARAGTVDPSRGSEPRT